MWEIATGTVMEIENLESEIECYRKKSGDVERRQNWIEKSRERIRHKVNSRRWTNDIRFHVERCSNKMDVRRLYRMVATWRPSLSSAFRRFSFIRLTLSSSFAIRTKTSLANLHFLLSPFELRVHPFSVNAHSQFTFTINGRLLILVLSSVTFIIASVKYNLSKLDRIKNISNSFYFEDSDSQSRSERLSQARNLKL